MDLDGLKPLILRLENCVDRLCHVIRQKHGTHDQSTHGRRGGEGKGELEEENIRLLQTEGRFFLGKVDPEKQGEIASALWEEDDNLARMGIVRNMKGKKGDTKLVQIVDKEGMAFKLKMDVDSAGGIGGAYLGNRDNIVISAGLRVREGPVKLGGWSVGENVRSVYRHEYGHRVYAKGMGAKQKTEWKKISYNYVDMPAGPKSVSKYGSTNREELFSESFSAYTSRSYKRGMLPADIESFMDKHVMGGGE